MINSLTSITAVENVLIKFTIRYKQSVYQIARLEYRIYKNLIKLEAVNTLILEEEKNLKSLNNAINAAGKGKVEEKLSIWKIKAEYKLFKLNLRRNKIDIVKLVLNQSQLAQLKQSLEALEVDIKKVEAQKLKITSAKTKSTNGLKKTGIFNSVEIIKQTEENNTVNQSIKDYIREFMQMAS